MLQDFDAQPYGLERHLPALANYVRTGGGLVMVGGPNSFVAGGYAGTPLADVLPVSLEAPPGATAADTAPFVPDVDRASGRDVPMLGPLAQRRRRRAAADARRQRPRRRARATRSSLWSHPRR